MDTWQRQALLSLSTATITMVLMKRGLRNVWLRGPLTLDPSQPRVVGPAFTMRFVPGREDLATPESLSSPRSTRFAIEEMPEGCIAVLSSSGIVDAGVLGDILCARMAKRGVAGLVTEGAVRDVEAVRKTGLPIWCAGVSAPPSVARLTFVDWQTPIGCGGVAILPGDIIVADHDGAVVIPQAIVQTVIDLGREGETLEGWILEQVNAGRKLPGLYPPDEATRAEFQAWQQRRHSGR
ncbi:MAG: ribonuclease activity regulator RraA [Janthinobacterium lividum]